MRVIPFPIVSLGPSIFPCGRTTRPSAPSRLLPSGVTPEMQVPLRLPPDRGCPHLPADVTRTAPFEAQGPMPALTRRRCSHGYPLRVSPSAVDACPGSPQMITHSYLPLRASPSAVDARAPARMTLRPAVPGVEMDACGKGAGNFPRSGPRRPG